MANEHEIVLTPVLSTVTTDNKKLQDSLNALAGKYSISLDVAIDTKKVDSILKNLQSAVAKANTTATVKFDDFTGANVSLKNISAVTAEKLKQYKANEQLLANERQRAAIEEANSKIQIAASRANVQSNREEISQSKVKIQLANEQMKLAEIAQRQARITPSDMQSKLLGKMDNTLLGNLSSSDSSALQSLRDGLASVDVASDKAKIKIQEFGQEYKLLLSNMKKGSLVDNSVGINVGSTDNELRQYIADLRSVQAEQIKITNSGRIMFGQDGSQIRVVNALVTNGTGEWQKYQYAINATNGEVRELSQGVRQVNQNADGALDAMASAIVASGTLQAIDAVKDKLYACVQAATELESGMAGVRRTMGGTDEEITGLKDSFLEMSKTIPVSVTELAKIAEDAGSLGIAREDAEEFVRVISQLSTATDLTSERASALIAEFGNITHLGVDEYEQFGSTLAYLGDATAATSGKIMDISQRIAASSSIAGMSKQEILALAATVGSLGEGAEAGGTAVSKLVSSLQLAVETGEGLEDFAAVAGMSGQEFAKAWGDSSITALNAFVQGLNDTERNGASAIQILDQLNMSEARLSRVVLSLAQSGGFLTENIQKSNQAWNDNTALAEKAGIAYETTAAKLQLADNAINQTKVAIGDALAPMFNVLLDGVTSISLGIADFVKNNQWLVQALTAIGAPLATATARLVAYSAAMKAIKALDLGTNLKNIQSGLSKFLQGAARLKYRASKSFWDIDRPITEHGYSRRVANRLQRLVSYQPVYVPA